MCLAANTTLFIFYRRARRTHVVLEEQNGLPSCSAMIAPTRPEPEQHIFDTEIMRSIHTDFPDNIYLCTLLCPANSASVIRTKGAMVSRTRPAPPPPTLEKVTRGYLAPCMRRRKHVQACFERWSATLGGELHTSNKKVTMLFSTSVAVATFALYVYSLPA